MFVFSMIVITTLLNWIYAYKAKSLGIVLWSILFLMFTLPHYFLVINKYIDINVLNIAGIFVVFFNMCYFITYFFMGKFLRLNTKALFTKKSIVNSNNIMNILLIIYLSTILLVILNIIINGYSLTNLTWLERRELDKSIITRMCKILTIALGGLGCYFLLKKEKLKFVLILIGFLIYLIVTKARYDILPFTMPFLVYYLYTGPLKNKFKTASIALIALFGVFLLQQIRYLGEFSRLFEPGVFRQVILNTFSIITEGKGEFSLSKAFYFFVEHNNEFSKFGEGLTYIRLLLLPFPSSLLESKPRDFAMDMWEAWNGVSTTFGTMHPTLYGDLYANFGFLGFLGGIAYALFVIGVDFIIRNLNFEYRVLFVGIFSTMFVLLGRGAVYNSIVNAVLSIVVVILLVKIIKMLVSNKNKQMKVTK